MEYLSLSRRRERVGISSHWGNGSGMRLRRLEWNEGKKCENYLSETII